MKKVLAVAFLACFGAAAAFAHHGPTSVMIDAAKSKQPGVTFPHAKHMTVVKSCETCHHTDKGLTKETDKNVQKCSSCHLSGKDGAPSMKEMSMQKNPFHALCINCHKEQKKGPTSCKDCHAKK